MDDIAGRPGAVYEYRFPGPPAQGFKAEGTGAGKQIQNPLPIVYDRWTEIRLEMDFDADYVEQYYDGQLLASGLWAIRGGAVALANLDLYAFLVASPVYWDDLSLVPEPGACVLLALLAGVALRRR